MTVQKIACWIDVMNLIVKLVAVYVCMPTCVMVDVSIVGLLCLVFGPLLMLKLASAWECKV